MTTKIDPKKRDLFAAEDVTVIPVINPANGEVIATVPSGGAVEAKNAVDAAYEALSTWSRKTANERAERLLKWYKLIDEEKEVIGKIMTREQGKPLHEAIGEVLYGNSFISWYAEEGKRIYGETIPASHENKRIVV
ncbi:MAG: succinate-semialdehyde dehydrogenase, partial [Bacillus sp. (in: firmicutes)]|nr:succinate-semialdehyde dehydrogenase [Bacillus sp. (in: firmicutes)]